MRTEPNRVSEKPRAFSSRGATNLPTNNSSTRLQQTSPEFQQLIQQNSFKRLPLKIRDTIIRVAQNDPSLTSLDLFRNGIGDDGAKALATALKTNTWLTSLELGFNSIGADGATALAAALKTNTWLTSLELESNRIGDEGANALAAALKTNTSLTLLNLGGNRIGDETNSTIHTLIIKNREEFKSRFSQFCTTLAIFQLIQKNGFSFPNHEVQGLEYKIVEYALHPSKKFTTFVPRPMPPLNSPPIFQSQVFETLNAHPSPQEKRTFLLATFSNRQYTKIPGWLR